QSATRLIAYMATSGRIDLLDEVADEIRILGDEQTGRLRAVVRTVVALTPTQRARLTAALAKHVGRPVELTETIDPSILGGLVCQVGELTFDNSLARQLDRLRDQLVA